MEKMRELSLVEELGGGPEKPRFKVKKWGVIPPKRRSVKRMMFDKFVKSVSSLFDARRQPVSSGAVSTSQPKNRGSLEQEGEVLKVGPCGKAKNTRIFPRKDHLLVNARQHDQSSN